MARIFTAAIQLPDGTSATYENSVLTVKGKSGEVSRELETSKNAVAVEGSTIKITSLSGNKPAKKQFGSLRAHVHNLVKGASEGHTFKLKICSSHFPMNVTVKGQQLEIKNFFGERASRFVPIDPAVKAKVDGQDLIIESPDIEAAGRFASMVEKTTRRTAFDKRIFQDGLHITEKAGKAIQ